MLALYRAFIALALLGIIGLAATGVIYQASRVLVCSENNRVVALNNQEDYFKAQADWWKAETKVWQQLYEQNRGLGPLNYRNGR